MKPRLNVHEIDTMHQIIDATEIKLIKKSRDMKKKKSRFTDKDYKSDKSKTKRKQIIVARIIRIHTAEPIAEHKKSNNFTQKPLSTQVKAILLPNQRCQRNLSKYLPK